MEEKDIYFKQTGLFDPEKTQNPVFIYGVGSIGSWVALQLAKMGVKDITVYDADQVEAANTPAQAYSLKDVGQKKVEAIKQKVLEETGTEIKAENVWIDEAFKCDITINSTHILCFDEIEPRVLVWNKLKGYPVNVLDGRIGSYQSELRYVRANEPCQDYEQSFKGTFSELECGMKTLVGVNTRLAGSICGAYIMLTKRQKPPYCLIESLMDYGSPILQREQKNGN